MQLFLDLDGVLADFDAHYDAHFAPLPRRDTWHGHGDPPRMWKNIRSLKTFYRDMPMMPDAMTLWRAVAHLDPIILTGVPYQQVPEAEQHKREWMRLHFGADVKVVCCKSRDKRLYGKPGDVLVDDWLKYREHWEAMGGTFVLHETALKTIDALWKMRVL